MFFAILSSFHLYNGGQHNGERKPSYFTELNTFHLQTLYVQGIQNMRLWLQDWQTVDRENFTVRANGGYIGSLQDNIDIGNYNIMLMQSPLFDGTIPRQKSVDLFFNAFPGGFAWELLELFSGEVIYSKWFIKAVSWKHPWLRSYQNFRRV